ncbi:MAG: hypothetical protein AABY93_06435 [Bacteroidota bacterium]
MIKAILKTSIIAGTLDALAAIIILANMNAVGVFQYIASGAFGEGAFSGGIAMTITGVVFHYFIATSFTALYFILYPHMQFLRKQKLVSGVLYGLFVWSVMNLIVVPMSNTSKNPFSWGRASLNMTILVVCIGLPISLLARKYYSSKNSQHLRLRSCCLS